MTDVTNGGLRGDAFEMAETANCRIVIEENAIGSLVEPHVLDMLEKLQIDYLGVSLDALLIVAPPEVSQEICQVVKTAGVMMHEIGYVEQGKPESVLMVDGRENDFSPRFRESAYTPVKKVVDTTMRDFDEMKEGVLRASEAALQKKKRVLNNLKKKQMSP
jgi:hydrogenase expression/formation protein